jgi:hypothetical protein
MFAQRPGGLQIAAGGMGFNGSICVAKILNWQCRLWVNRVVSSVRHALPVCPRNQTYRCSALTDAKGQQQTSHA